MFTEPHTFLPKQRGLLARRARRSVIAETNISVPLNILTNSDFRWLNRSPLNVAITTFGMDGAMELIGAGFRVLAPEPR
jgi:hypothetical protein